MHSDSDIPSSKDHLSADDDSWLAVTLARGVLF
jgi:hypothetical protein